MLVFFNGVYIDHYACNRLQFLYTNAFSEVWALIKYKHGELIIILHMASQQVSIHFDYCHPEPGGHFNIKMPSYQYRDSHVKEMTVSPTVLSLT